jgi:hypothetical protein
MVEMSDTAPTPVTAPRRRGNPHGTPGNLTNAGKGRPKGVPNKFGVGLKGAILQSFAEVGGIKWLNKLAESHPPVYATLLGRVLPLEVTGAGGGPLIVSWDMSGFSTPNAPAIASPNAPLIEGAIVRDAEVVSDGPGRPGGDVAVGEATD